MLDRHPTLRLLLAHSGGALPQLSSRLASCIDHDPAVASRLDPLVGLLLDRAAPTAEDAVRLQAALLDAGARPTGA